MDMCWQQIPQKLVMTSTTMMGMAEPTAANLKVSTSTQVEALATSASSPTLVEMASTSQNTVNSVMMETQHPLTAVTPPATLKMAGTDLSQQVL